MRSGLAVCCALFSILSPWSRAASPAPQWPGPKADGSVLLPNMWSLKPAGSQVDLGDFPVNIAVHPSGKYAAILHSGYGQHEVVVVELKGKTIASRTKLPESFYGIEFSRDGRQLFCSGAGNEVVHLFGFKDGSLDGHETLRLRDAKERGVPAGLTLSADAKRLYVANVWGHRVTRVDLAAGATNVTDIVLNAEASPLVTRQPEKVDPDIAAITKRAEAQLEQTKSADPFPYDCVLDEKRARLYVSLWAQAQVAVIDTATGKVTALWPTEEHPNEMILSKSGGLLYVANANRNTVSVIDTDSGHAVETLYGALYPNLPAGGTPNSLALTPDEKTLFVANANVNNVAVFDVSKRGKSRSMGFIPVGWYPTSVRVTPDGRQLLVANGKGGASKPNPNGPQPGLKAKTGTTVEYIAGLMRGTLSIIDIPSRSAFERQMETFTARCYANSPIQRDSAVPVARPADNPIPGKVGDPSPIQYCIYIIKENRTYDQILGDMKEGNGDASICLFPEKVTPNHHAIAREFVLLDNFYVESEVSADGHEWTMGAYATDFVEKFWPMGYGHNQSKKYPYVAEGNFPIATPAGGYLWDRAREAGVSYRSYGEFVQAGRTARDPAKARVKALEGHIDEYYHGFDMDYSDLKRADRFISELRRFEKEGDMPRLQIVRLPNDHTSGAAVGKPTPTAYVAENDLALGQVIEAVSKSKFWAKTAIFVVEDDAQNGSDHVDAHRTIAFVVSPYTKRKVVDSTMYSTSSMLRTMELILGLKPMSQFDAAATPMFHSFQAKPDLSPYFAKPAQVELDQKNLKTAWGADKSRKMDFTKEDAADDLLLNEIIWRSVRGPQSKMPSPVRAAFVFTHAAKDDDD
ncbi:MAG TPA: bifunctional YncE family protein/alkaline phosphatase family protein [Roseimicrobium sp.]|nr:bifunctional YncE family protein/alkaline phosphatase family protein [Roseimicrobium sp.]